MNFKIGDKVTWGLDGEKVTVIEMEDLNISLKIPPEYTPKNADGTPWKGSWKDSLVVREEE